MAIVVKSPHEIESMRRAGRVLAQLLKVLSAEVRPGMKTMELDRITARELSRHGRGRRSWVTMGSLLAFACPLTMK